MEIDPDAPSDFRFVSALFVGLLLTALPADSTRANAPEGYSFLRYEDSLRLALYHTMR